MGEKNFFKFVTLISFILLTGCSDEEVCIDSDLVFLNNTIYTANSDQPKAELLAIKDDKIIFVGSASQVNSYDCGSNRVSSLENSFIYPGFIDAHAHLKGIGYRELNLNLQGAESLKSMLTQVKIYSNQVEIGEWIIGRG